MTVGIVEQKFSRRTRRIFYVLHMLILIIAYPLLKAVGIETPIAEILLSFMIFGSLFFIHRIVEGVKIIGKIQVKDDSFILDQNNKQVSVPFKEIQMFLLIPVLGSSRISENYKVYACQIRTNENNHRLNLTREEVRNGKIINKNITRPSAFDLIHFLKKKHIQHRIGDYESGEIVENDLK